MSDSQLTAFAVANFDANEYAKSVLAGPSTTSVSVGAQQTSVEPAKEDISVAIAKLTYSIEDVSKEIKSVITTHHESLLVRAAGVNGLQNSVTSVKSGLDEITASVEKLRQKIHLPYESLSQHISRLERLQQATDVLRRIARFVIVARRLEFQMSEIQRLEKSAKSLGSANSANAGFSTNGTGEKTRSSEAISVAQAQDSEKERTIAKAALSIAELVALLDSSAETNTNNDDESESQHASIPLHSINAVSAHIPTIHSARAKVTNEMESMVLTGLSSLNQPLLSLSLQTAFNLRVLPEVAQSLVMNLTDAVEMRIRVAFDMSRIAKDVAAKDASSTQQGMAYKSRIRTEPTNVTAPQWTAAIWARLEGLVEEMVGCCIKVITLEKVLKLKYDPTTQTNFLDETMKVLENTPTAAFWTTLARGLERQSKESARNSSFLQQTLTSGYPRLLRLFHDFFVQIAVHTDVTYTQDKQSPETVVVLRALSHFEALYLSRSQNRLNEAVGHAFSGVSRSPPGVADGLNIARTVANELDSARFDPLLVLSVARNIKASLDQMLMRVEPLIAKDRWAVTLLGPTSTPQQSQNAALASFLYNCWTGLSKSSTEYPNSVVAILDPSIRNINKTYEGIINPLLAAIRRELQAIIAKLHRVDFSKNLDTMSGHGGPSVYMKDLVEKIAFVKREILSKFAVGDATREWVTSIVKSVIRTFVLHMSIAKPLGESGKLQLTSDMTELEFALGTFLSEGNQSKHGAKLDFIGDDYKALRAMRPLLFLDNGQLSSRDHTSAAPPLIVLHHILVRSPIPLPHVLHGWQESEYVRWVDGHTEEEALTLIEGVLVHWEKVHDSPSEELDTSKEYLALARTVLSNTRDNIHQM